MWKDIFVFELKYRLRRPATYIYFGVFFLLGLIIFLTDVVRVSGAFGKVNSNAPFIIFAFIEQLGAVLGIFIFMAIMSVPIYRDVEHNSDTFLYAYPIKKSGYLLGRFFGSLLIAYLVVAGLPLGMMMGEGIKKLTADATVLEHWGSFNAWAYLNPLLVSVFPNLLFLGAIYFALPALTRKVFIAYVVAISLLVLYAITGNLLADLDNKTIAGLLDPFGFRASGEVTNYWSINEKNTLTVPIEGVYLWNRLLWAGIGLGIFVFCYFRFQFQVSGTGGGGKKLMDKLKQTFALPTTDPQVNKRFTAQTAWQQFRSLFRLEFSATVRNPFFLAITFAIGLYLIMDAWYADSTYGTGIYPTTGVILEAKNGLFSALCLALLIFMAGEVVWRERQLNLNQVYDALPMPRTVPFFAKLVSILAIPTLLMFVVMFVCMLVQTFKGYFRYEIGLYLTDLFVFTLPGFLIIAILTFVVQVVANNKYLGHFLVVLHYLSLIAMNRLGLEHPLWRFGSGSDYTYSDMNGFGDFVRPFGWYTLHWLLVCGVLLSIAYLVYVDGTESGLRSRLQEMARRWKFGAGIRLAAIASIVACLTTGGYIYYNTVTLDKFTGEKATQKQQVAYEKTYKRLERTSQPKITDVYAEVDMYPKTGDLKIRGKYMLQNKTRDIIDTLYLTSPRFSNLKTPEFSRPAALVKKDSTYNIWFYHLPGGLKPGETLSVKFDMGYAYTGFNNESDVIANGTFINNDKLPDIGYNRGLELRDEDKRKEFGLPETPPLPKQTDSLASQFGFISQNSDDITFEVVMSTDDDQIAIAPGYLKKEWKQDGRAYYYYKMDQPIVNFYSLQSARYSVTKDKWNDVDIAIYHHPWHTFNVDKMIGSVKRSLAYYTQNFGPYQHKQVRILEFPRYQSFAQSFDNTIPYSEGIGFIAKVQDKEKDVDYVYYVTAHEMAHQWWGHQVYPSVARGFQFLSETMSQYSALMVMQQEYGMGPMRKFLQYELDRYLRGRSGESRKENSLMDVELQSYVYYRKGSVVMYSLQDYMGEQPFNKAVGKYLNMVKFSGPPFTNTNVWHDVVHLSVPDSLKPYMADQLERITFYDNRLLEAKGKKLADSTWQVSLKVKTGKFYADSLGKEISAPMSERVDIGILLRKTPQKMQDVLLLEKRNLKDGEQTIVLQVISKKRPGYAGIDPINKLVDKVSDDNIKAIDWE